MLILSVEIGEFERNQITPTHLTKHLQGVTPYVFRTWFEAAKSFLRKLCKTLDFIVFRTWFEAAKSFLRKLMQGLRLYSVKNAHNVKVAPKYYFLEVKFNT